MGKGVGVYECINIKGYLQILNVPNPACLPLKKGNFPEMTKNPCSEYSAHMKSFLSDFHMINTIRGNTKSDADILIFIGIRINRQQSRVILLPLIKAR